MTRPIRNKGMPRGIDHAARGFLPNSICVAPTYTITANAIARPRCEIQPDATVDNSEPTTIPGTMRRTNVQSTAPCL